MTLSLVIPVYRNEASIPDLVQALEELNTALGKAFEVVFVVDGSPDRSLECLRRVLPDAAFRSRLLVLSRNFGSFSAIRAGLAAGRGEHFAVMAADLQEPPELIVAFFDALQGGLCDVAVGRRDSRSDPLFDRLFSRAFWGLYRAFVQRDVPRGGVDVFGCTLRFRDQLLALSERNSTLVGLIFWLGFRRLEIPYSRRPRKHGESGWSFRRKVRYLLDSCFAFSDLPIRLLSFFGFSGITLSLIFGAVVLIARIDGRIQVPGYTATVLTVMFFGGLNSLGIGILGEYLWRTFENTKGRPDHVVISSDEFSGAAGVSSRRG
ncbi:MAG: glycosyltransferase family 2 protein [Thermoanaerobaculia bacterium]